jgi:hypothetical protein
MLKTIKRFIATIAAALALPLMTAMPIASAAGTTMTVTPANTQGWVLNGDLTTATPYEFSEDQASIGEGSLFVPAIGANASDKFIAALPLGVAASDLTSVSYDFMVAGNGDETDANQFYLNVYTNLPDSTTFYDCRFDFVPTEGSTTEFTTATFNTSDTPVNVASRGGATCPATLAGMPAGSTVSFIALNVGDTSANDLGLAGYLDNVVVTTTAGETVYDFEQDPTALTSKEACKNGGWMLSEAPVFKNQGQCVSFFAKQQQLAL